jgi:hypothetical protein
MCSLKWRTYVRFVSQSNVREPRENRGRLRHCNGLQTPNATSRIRPGRRERGKARSQDTGLNALVRSDESKVQRPMSKVDSTLDLGPWTLDLSDQLLRQEKDEASPFRVCGSGFTECLHSLFCRDEGFFVFTVRSRHRSRPRFSIKQVRGRGRGRRGERPLPALVSNH